MWPQLINTAIGIWLMTAPAVLGYDGAAQNNDHILGPVIATFACIAIWESTRSVRWANLPIGLWMIVAPWILGYESMAATANSVVCGVAVILFSCWRGKVEQQFGGGWPAIWRSGSSEYSS